MKSGYFPPPRQKANGFLSNLEVNIDCKVHLVPKLTQLEVAIHPLKQVIKRIVHTDSQNKEAA